MNAGPPDDLRLHSAAAERNRVPLLAALQRLLPPHGQALEIASGTGQHAAHFAAALPGWRWQPTEADPRLGDSIRAWCRDLPNVAAPLRLDVTAPVWHGVPSVVDLLFCANLLHIAPWPSTPALMQGAARHLAQAGLLCIYGPFIEDGVPTAASNLDFDADLRRRDPSWGLRRLPDVLAAAVGRRAAPAGAAAAAGQQPAVGVV
ncbi:DUF938 domain-containing protein [Rubrivivax sp. RP6-9]|uniref:DUF938 domain-containing protein n=1 Tax=Rubrivivax sp. RP6-9 TaxID=3415750 RepID=UPI003CC5F24B